MILIPNSSPSRAIFFVSNTGRCKVEGQNSDGQRVTVFERSRPSRWILPTNEDLHHVKFFSAHVFDSSAFSVGNCTIVSDSLVG